MEAVITDKTEKAAYALGYDMGRFEADANLPFDDCIPPELPADVRQAYKVGYQTGYYAKW